MEFGKSFILSTEKCFPGKNQVDSRECCTTICGTEVGFQILNLICKFIKMSQAPLFYQRHPGCERIRCKIPLLGRSRLGFRRAIRCKWHRYQILEIQVKGTRRILFYPYGNISYVHDCLVSAREPVSEVELVPTSGAVLTYADLTMSLRFTCGHCGAVVLDNLLARAA